MEKQPGWTVTKHAYGLETAFLCEFKNKPEENPTIVSINSEFDALPNVGHACGHNLIAVCGITAALSTANAMAKFDIPGTVRLIGTPAEEGGGGKIKLIEAGAYKDVDVSLMAHPFNKDPTSYGYTNANQRFIVEFFGKEAHAAASPWQGINALDAMVLMYNAVSVLRQQLLSTDVVQCNINDGGHVPNIICGHSESMFAVRAPTLGRLRELQAKVENCAKAAALATGCKYKITLWTNYYNLICNDVLAACHTKYMTDVFGQKMPPLEEDRRTSRMSASTDQGNVSWVVPALQPLFNVVCEDGPHTKVFAAAAGTKKSHESALETGMCLGFTSLELLLSQEKLAEVKAAWAADIKEQEASVTSASEVITDLSQLIYKD